MLKIFQLGNLRDAVTDCTGALKINDKYVKALLKRARCQYDMENFEEAVKDYELALKLDKSVRENEKSFENSRIFNTFSFLSSRWKQRTH